MPPGTRVVSWTSRASEVTRWPLRTLRISVVSDLCGVSFSKGYIAEGKTLASAAAAAEGMIAGSRAAGSMVQRSRREIGMRFSLRVLIFDSLLTAGFRPLARLGIKKRAVRRANGRHLAAVRLGRRTVQRPKTIYRIARRC